MKQPSQTNSFVQKVPGRVKLTHTFHDKSLEYTYKSHGESRTSNIPYANISGNITELKGVKEGGYNTATLAVIFCILLTVFLQFVATPENSGLGGTTLESSRATLMILVFGLFIAQYLSKRDYTVFNTADGSVLVIKDKNHDAIVENIKAHRITALRKLAEIDPFEPPQQAWERLKWLNGEGIITDLELSKHREMIDKKINDQPQETKTTLN